MERGVVRQVERDERRLARRAGATVEPVEWELVLELVLVSLQQPKSTALGASACFDRCGAAQTRCGPPRRARGTNGPRRYHNRTDITCTRSPGLRFPAPRTLCSLIP